MLTGARAWSSSARSGCGTLAQRRYLSSVRVGWCCHIRARGVRIVEILGFIGIHIVIARHRRHWWRGGMWGCCRCRDESLYRFEDLQRGRSSNLLSFVSRDPRSRDVGDFGSHPFVISASSKYVFSMFLKPIVIDRPLGRSRCWEPM